MRPVLLFFLEDLILKTELLEAAKLRVPSAPILVNMLSKRVRQLNSGQGPLVKPEKNDERIDIAMREIAEGKLIAEIDFSAVAAEEDK
ncbi:DNA-directed RNA polymerase subunit omega [PVC group bacterium]|nr:DNA-directed RNA polymerase subunit omega [PVC group bacterium]